jgi:hypothetical protein
VELDDWRDKREAEEAAREETKGKRLLMFATLASTGATVRLGHFHGDEHKLTASGDDNAVVFCDHDRHKRFGTEVQKKCGPKPIAEELDRLTMKVEYRASSDALLRCVHQGNHPLLHLAMKPSEDSDYLNEWADLPSLKPTLLLPATSGETSRLMLEVGKSDYMKY